MEKIFLAGHNGMVGGAIYRLLDSKRRFKLVTAPKRRLDLLDQKCVENFFKKFKPDRVILAAARVGGIFANNTYPAKFIYENLQIQNNIIHSAYKTKVKRLLFLGSSCIYPKYADQPMSEKSLLTGELEPTNEPYAISKIAGIKMCESYNREYGCDFRSIMPTNLYGPGDNYHPENSHVIPALIQRFHHAKVQNESEVTVWGTGGARREFMHVDDLARAAVFVLGVSKNLYQGSTQPMLSHINVGVGKDITIKDLAQLISEIIEYKGLIKFDRTMPDGAPRKLLNSEKLKKLGWQPKIDLQEGISLAYKDYLKSIPLKI